MTDPRRKRQDGVRTLSDLRSRCVIDDETGCWMWRGAMSADRTPRVWMPLLRDAEGITTTGARAAWLLSGRKLPEGHVVWRRIGTCGNECINPLHGVCGTRQQMHAAIARDGRMKGNPLRAAVNARNRVRMMLSPEIVRLGEAMYEAGALQKEVKAALGIGNASAKKIRMRTHQHSTGRVNVVRGASVFAWREAA